MAVNNDGDTATKSGPQFQPVSKTSLESHHSNHADGLRKRSALKKLIKDNTKCDHSAIYSQISFICRRLAASHEEGRITMEQAMQLIFDAHDRLAHKGLPVETVAEEMHKRLDKLEANDRPRRPKSTARDGGKSGGMVDRFRLVQWHTFGLRNTI